MPCTGPVPCTHPVPATPGSRNPATSAGTTEPAARSHRSHHASAIVNVDVSSNYRLRRSVHPPLDSKQVSPLRHNFVTRIQHAKIHTQVIWKRQGRKLRGGHLHSHPLRHPFRKPLVKSGQASQAICLDRQVIQRRLRIVRHRHQQFSLRFGQGTKHGNDLLEPQTGNQPGDLLCIDHIEQRLRNHQSHAITRLGRIELVQQRQLIATDRKLGRKRLRTRFRHLTLHQIRPGHVQQPRLGALGLDAPMVERRDGIDALGNTGRVKLNLLLLVHHDIASADLRLQVFDLSAQPAVGLEKCALNHHR